jgi:hypothetical protein
MTRLATRALTALELLAVVLALAVPLFIAVRVARTDPRVAAPEESRMDAVFPSAWE